MGPKGPGPPVQFFILFIVIIYFCSWFPPKILAPFLLNKPSQLHSNSSYSTPKLNKNNNNIHDGNCILGKKKIYYQRTKKSRVIRESKTKFFAIIVN